MPGIMESLDAAIPAIHSIIFIIGVSSNVGLLLASFHRTPQTLKASQLLKLVVFVEINIIYLELLNNDQNRVSQRSCRWFLSFRYNVTVLFREIVN